MTAMRSPFFIFKGAGGTLSALDNLSTQYPAGAYSLRRLKTRYENSAIRVRRSIDNAERDIGFADTIQTRTNLAPVPINAGGTFNATGLTFTNLGSGVEFGLPYVDIRWQGTATSTTTAHAVIAHGGFNASDPDLVVIVQTGLVYTASMSYRLIAGTYPTGQAGIRHTWRNTAGTFISQTLVNIPSPTSSIARSSVVGVAPTGASFSQPAFTQAFTLGDVVDFTMRFYAASVVQGVGNARPMLQRNTPEVIANIGDLDAESLLAYTNGINNLTFSEEFENAVWTIGGASVVANSTIAPTGALTCDVITENAVASTQHRFNRGLSLTASIPVTLSVYVKRVVGTRQFQLGISGGSLVAKAYFDLATGTVGYTQQCTASISAEKEGFYRVSLTATPDTTVSHNMFWAMTNATTNGSETYNGDGISSIAIWGTQLNQGNLIGYCPTGATATTGLGSGFVTTWYDQSGNGRNATQTTAGNQPSLVSNGTCSSNAGHPSVPFDGTTTFLNATLPLGMETTALFVVLNTNQILGGSTHKVLLAGNGTSFLTTGTTYGVSYSANTTVLGVSLGNGTTEQRADISNTITNNLEVVGFRRSGNSTSMLRNGVVGVTGTQDRTTGFGSAYCIGADPSSTRFYNGAISESVLFISALSTADRQALERNQGDYYGVTIT